MLDRRPIGQKKLAAICSMSVPDDLYAVVMRDFVHQIVSIDSLSKVYPPPPKKIDYEGLMTIVEEFKEIVEHEAQGDYLQLGREKVNQTETYINRAKYHLKTRAILRRQLMNLGPPDTTYFKAKPLIGRKKRLTH